ncbi:MAG: hypothetical protein Tsb0015_13650 [Simkaniaceae bacterium]
MLFFTTLFIKIFHEIASSLFLGLAIRFQGFKGNPRERKQSFKEAYKEIEVKFGEDNGTKNESNN